MIKSFRSRALRRFWVRADASKLRPDWVAKTTRLLSALDQATRPEDMNLPGSGFHALTGDMAGRYACTVSRNWRLTFGFKGGDAVEVDLEDYHGD